MARLYGCTGRLTAQNGGFRPGQVAACVFMFTLQTFLDHAYGAGGRETETEAEAETETESDTHRETERETRTEGQTRRQTERKRARDNDRDKERRWKW